MTSKTRQELIIEALDNLNIIVPGQAPSTAIVSKMDGLVNPVIDQLADLDIYYVRDAGEIGPSGGEIESSAFLALAAYLANAAASKFNLPADTKLKALAMEAEGMLTTLSRPASTRNRLIVDIAIPTPGRRWNWTLG